ncbi:MAG: hypothetical protein J1F38_04055 [Muribaculaceae bacterium]|nr:hypothetical protein [Muribaculaceae bacterium]
MKLKKYIYTSIILYSVGFVACTDELIDKSVEGEREGIFPLRAEITLGEGFLPHTRVGLNPDDGWTYGSSRITGFKVGDEVGVFSRGGNMAEDNGNGHIINIPMTYTLVSVSDNTSGDQTETYTFMNSDLKMYTEAMRSGGVFMYYPYSEEMGNKSNVITTSNSYGQYETMNTTPGLPLRVKPEGSDDYRCRDLLQIPSVDASDLKKGVLRGTASHAFAEIGIIRGEGFKNPPPDKRDIWVVLTEPYTHVRIVANPNTVGWILQMVSFDEKQQWAQQYAQETGLDKEDFKKWKCWEGRAPASFITDNENNEDFEYEDGDELPPFYYVVIPTTSYGVSSSSAVNYRSTVSEIYLADDRGEYQHVTSFNLNANSTTESTDISKRTDVADKYPRYRNRYFLQIQTSELGPTVSQVEIKDWIKDEENDITEKRERGINDVAGYNAWVDLYKVYKTNPNEEQTKENLKAYGDYDVTNGIWHFYINKDLTFIPNNPDFTPHIIEQFDDVLESGSQFYNMTLSGIRLSQPLISKMAGNAAIKRLDFDGIYIKYTSEQPKPIGAIAGTVEGSSITGGGSNSFAKGWFEKVNIINGTVISNGPVGILSGTMTSGWINKCSFSGFISGSSTSGFENTGNTGDMNIKSSKILGVTPSVNMPSIDDTDADGVIFTN